MKRKKLVASAMAGMLVAAQMVMPVAAAAAEGTVTTNLETITPLVRVVVPTSLQIGVNQFEKDDMGSQIYSKPFEITNKSEVPVKVKVTSTVTLGTGGDAATLATTKEGAETTTDSKKAWLAAAAQVAKNQYHANTAKGIKDLTETDSNVATVTTASGGDSTAEQTFYLSTGATSSSKLTYKSVAPTAATLDEAKKIVCSQFNVMQEQTVADTEALQTAVDADDIYEIKADGTVKLLAKGTANVAKDTEDTTKYYKLGAAKKASDLAASSVYVYAEAPVGGTAAFRYIGKLSQQDGWSNTNIKTIAIGYSIDAISQDSYNGVKNYCTYGLFPTLSAAMTVNGVSVTNAGGTVAYASKTEVATKLKTAGGALFVMDARTASIVKANKLSLAKISVKSTAGGTATDYTATDTTNKYTVIPATGASANSDGNCYAITGLSGSEVVEIQLVYGTGDKTVTVKYTFN